MRANQNKPADWHPTRANASENAGGKMPRTKAGKTPIPTLLFIRANPGEMHMDMCVERL